MGNNKFLAMASSLKVGDPKIMLADKNGNVEVSSFPSVVDEYGNKIKTSIGDVFRCNGAFYRIVEDGCHENKSKPKEVEILRSKTTFTAFGRSKVNIYG